MQLIYRKNTGSSLSTTTGFLSLPLSSIITNKASEGDGIPAELLDVLKDDAVKVLFIVNLNTVKVKSLSRVQLFVTPWTVAYQAAPSMGFSRQEYWSGLLFPSPGDLPDPGIEPGSPTFQADALTSEPMHLFIVKHHYEQS